MLLLESDAKEAAGIQATTWLPNLYYRRESMVESLEAPRGDHAATAAREGVPKVFRILAGSCHVKFKHLKFSRFIPQ